METVRLELNSNEVLTLYKVLASLSDAAALEETMKGLSLMERMDINRIFEVVITEAINLEGFERKRLEE